MNYTFNLNDSINPNDLACMIKNEKGIYEISSQCMYNSGIEILQKQFYKIAVYIIIVFLFTTILKYILIKIWKDNNELQNNIIKGIIDNIQIIDYIVIMTYLGLIIWYGVKQGILF